jgi:hypothetical protein
VLYPVFTGWNFHSQQIHFSANLTARNDRKKMDEQKDVAFPTSLGASASPSRSRRLCRDFHTLASVATPR